jgi:hypothetical protein
MTHNKIKRYITFYKICLLPVPHICRYGMMCNRSRWQAFKMGLKHIKKGNAHFFVFWKNTSI